METKICNGCGAQIGEDEWFCPFCDNGLDDGDEDFHCPLCFSVVSNDSETCYNCHADLSENEPLNEDEFDPYCPSCLGPVYGYFSGRKRCDWCGADFIKNKPVLKDEREELAHERRGRRVGPELKRVVLKCANQYGVGCASATHLVPTTTIRNWISGSRVAR